jgi:acetyl/propionyl-CoA carboxylase alpha subunit
MREANYYSAGTVEFLLDQKGSYYFLEVNTRLQVEHPITEFVTGVDLVKAMIRIAAGEPLPIKQSDISQRGHAIECRLYAEDPENQFLPSEGMVGVLREPIRPGVRIDSFLEAGKLILPFYDPLLAKLIVWAENRGEAISKMDALLRDYVLLGIHHNLDFLRHVLGSKDFISGTYHTHSVSQLMDRYQESRIARVKQLQPLASALAIQGSPVVASPSKGSPSLQGLEGFRNV